MPYVILILVMTFGGIGFGGYSYYTSTQARIEALQANNAKLESVAKTNQDTIQRMTDNIQLMEEANKELQADLDAASEYKDQLIAKLQKHDLALLSLKKPGLIEKRINDGTKKVFDTLESLSSRP